MKITIMLGALAVFALMAHTQADQILPDVACIFCLSLFRNFGCLDNETPVCKIIALKFKLTIDGDRLCNNFICGGGYGEVGDGSTCKGQLQCLITKRQPLGICPVGQICCAP